LIDWREEPISRSHDRQAFDCGSDALNDYLRRYARQNHESDEAKTFVAVDVDGDPRSILGYYTITPAAIPLDVIPTEFMRGRGRYDLPVFLLARLGVAVAYQGQGLGSELLHAAGERAIRAASEIGGVALAIDAKDEQATAWYRRFGAVSLDDSPLTLLLPLDTLRQTLEL